MAEKEIKAGKLGRIQYNYTNIGILTVYCMRLYYNRTNFSKGVYKGVFGSV